MARRQILVIVYPGLPEEPQVELQLLVLWYLLLQIVRGSGAQSSLVVQLPGLIFPYVWLLVPELRLMDNSM